MKKPTPPTKTVAERSKKPLPGTTTLEDVKSAYQKWLAAKSNESKQNS